MGVPNVPVEDAENHEIVINNLDTLSSSVSVLFSGSRRREAAVKQQSRCTSAAEKSRGRRSGESLKAFDSRVDAESKAKQVALRSVVLNPRRAEKFQALKRRRAKVNEEKEGKQKEQTNVPDGAIPAYLLDREGVSRTKVLSNMIKQKRKEKAGKWQVPLPKVKAMTDDEMFEVMRSGKRKKKAWKRVINKVCFVGEDFTRKPPKYERYIRPSGLRFQRAHITHPDLKTTFYLNIVSVKKNPQSQLYSALGVITKGKTEYSTRNTIANRIAFNDVAPSLSYYVRTGRVFVSTVAEL